MAYASQYGAMPQTLEAGTFSPKTHHHKRRAKMTMSSMCTLLFVPWILFSVLYATVTFNLHYSIPLLCWTIVLAGMGISLIIGLAAWQKAQTQGPSWLLFLFATTVVAAVGGPLLGDINFWTNMQAFYDLKTLNQYSAVDTSNSKGEAMMDAGMVQFTQGSGLDMSKSVSFQDLDTYCATPIVTGNTSSNFDFWAVGLNCCPRNTSKQVVFKCGAYDSKTALQGLRLMDDSQRDYFRLAVQQAEAEFKIHAKHPLFFYWTEDANTDMQGYWDYGNKYFQVGVGAFFVLQIFLLMAATVVASKFEFD